MNHITKMDNLTRDTRRRDFDDGLMDFMLGGTLLGIGLFGGFFFSSMGLRWILNNLLHNQEITIIVLGTLFLLFISFMIGARRIIDRIRRIELWRNQGFIKSLHLQTSWRNNALAGTVFLATIIISDWLMVNGLIRQETVLRILVSSTGISLGIVLFGTGVELGLQRYTRVGPVGGGLSAIIIFLPIGFSNSWLLLGIIWMIVLSVSGSLALRKFILEMKDQESE